MIPNLRRSTRQRTASLGTQPSGSEYHESDGGMDVDDSIPVAKAEDEEEEEEPVEYAVTSRGRRIQKKSYRESASEDGGDGDGDGEDGLAPLGRREDVDVEGEDEEQPRYPLRRLTRGGVKNLNGFIVSDEEGEAGIGRYDTRSRSKKPVQSDGGHEGGRLTRQRAQAPRRLTRTRSGRRVRTRTRNNDAGDDGYIDEASDASQSAGDSFDEAPKTSPEPEPGPEPEMEADLDAEGEIDVEEKDGRPYALRQRAKINYAIPPPLEEMRAPSPKRAAPRATVRKNGGWGGRSKPPGWSATGAELGRWMGMGGDDSDSDYATRTPRKPFGGIAGAANMSGALAGGAGSGGGGLFPTDLAAAAGTPSNFGKVGDVALADTDPLGTNQNVSFDEVGGLDEHINSLKEMTVLPLLYPEVFQRFSVTPPRGVLFHGPPGTGKTLLARALAASCRSNGRGISFFMRKGADCLSKWVGEAERQLRLLFEEAKNSQPSIIFFDEIDGLAPVRSSKQDQIHASIVSTLLALMDGMDNRGQVVVIGATNRPDAIDPALRRPGRFDREFYFPLPKLEAREKILRIMTKKWAGWEGQKAEENVKGLAKATKGYGGADLRALCTEATLNAVQRRYPQIYTSTERLLLNPETIQVELRDFMISVKKIVPSSARSASSTAQPLPVQLAPLLQDALDRVKDAISKVLPVSKKRTALEEAEYEDEGEDGALERELMLQSMESLRVYRPRIVLHGPVGMGQGYVAAAALHHLEGYNIQSMDLGNLMGDSTRSVEAAIVQLFVEAKRNQPSVVYIPSLVSWCAAVSETSRSTIRAMMDTLSPSDPILLLAVVDGHFSELPRDVRAWFGVTRDNRVELSLPDNDKREVFFQGLLDDIRRPPNQFPDGVKRKKRVLEELPVAPPLQPRQPTAAELALQEDNDQKIITLLKYRLGPILTELKRKFKRFTKRATEEYDFNSQAPVPEIQVTDHTETVTKTIEVQGNDGAVTQTEQVEVVESHAENEVAAGLQVAQLEPQLFDMDLERMHVELYKGKYLTPSHFLQDVEKMVHNAHVRMHEDPDRLFKAQAMLTAAQVSMQEFDPQFTLECERMAGRERKRREARKRAKEEEKAREAAQSGVNSRGSSQGIRRSARHNGQQPEISITDPLLLERRLKRQRPDEVNGVNEAAPDVEQFGDDAEDDRATKRSRTAMSEDDEPDPLDLVGRASSVLRPNGVRFAPEAEPMPPLASFIHERDGACSPVAPSTPNRRPVLETPPSPESPKRIVDFEHPRGPSNQGNFLVNGFVSPSPYDISTPVRNSVHRNGTTTPQALNSPMPVDTEAVVDERAPLTAPAVENEAVAGMPTFSDPMDVARSISPVHPDFHVDEDFLASLKDDLVKDTGLLNIEQLEQLRASCLGCVWHHRFDWDRDALIKELKGVVEDFIDQVSQEDMVSE
ncbi:AAA-domain-containing protein [Neolentinus lepideus HHB14362 ss-1]|uniref:AAA-domain-containing protein n=1 Tax=Neolentinus lepideus HHB14362 ss-1 TaxID=1314782 RepID=A0A165R2B2_9AGAM|nr:AAA-domain-containing protein [Neolentinus lepideus HHB14362 ss-1]